MSGVKTIHSALGAKNGCVNFNPCPLCYGCRNYDSRYLACDVCAMDAKKNICDTKKHTEEALLFMIHKDTIKSGEIL